MPRLYHYLKRLAVAAVVWACGTPEAGTLSRNSSSRPSAVTSRVQSPPHAPADSIGGFADSFRTRADSVVARLARAINSGDVALLDSFVRPADWPPDPARDTLAARYVIRDFRRHLGDRPITRWEYVRGLAERGMIEARASHIEYDLVAEGGARKRIVVYRDGSTLRPYEEFLSYSPRVHGLVEAMLAAIRARDSMRVARLLNPDDVDYPADLAARAIERYARRYDLTTLRARFDSLPSLRRSGYHPQVDRPFHYTITGTKGGRPVEHHIVLVVGDGLVGWRDPLVPAHEAP
jgi:hypothetical protein